MSTRKTITFDQVIADFGQKVGLRILKKYGGFTICSPEAVLRALRDRKLYADFKMGMPPHEIRAKYYIDKKKYHAILGRMRAKFRVQPAAQPAIREDDDVED